MRWLIYHVSKDRQRQSLSSCKESLKRGKKAPFPDVEEAEAQVDDYESKRGCVRSKAMPASWGIAETQWRPPAFKHSKELPVEWSLHQDFWKAGAVGWPRAHAGGVSAALSQAWNRLTSKCLPSERFLFLMHREKHSRMAGMHVLLGWAPLTCLRRGQWGRSGCWLSDLPLVTHEGLAVGYLLNQAGGPGWLL